MAKSWGPYLMVSSSLSKANSKKVILNESFNFDLLRQELISAGLPLEIVKVSNPWYYRRKYNARWLKIGESSDIENDFPVEWDITGLEVGRYEVMGLMHMFGEEDCLEKLVTVGQNIAEVTVKN